MNGLSGLFDFSALPLQKFCVEQQFVEQNDGEFVKRCVGEIESKTKSEINFQSDGIELIMEKEK